MTPEDLVLFARTADPVVKACQDALHTKHVRYRGSALLGAAEARQLIQAKKAAAEKERARHDGFETLISTLDRLAPTKKVSVHHFSGEGMLFSVAVEPGDIQPLGGIGVWHQQDAAHVPSAQPAAGGAGRAALSALGKQ